MGYTQDALDVGFVILREKALSYKYHTKILHDVTLPQTRSKACHLAGLNIENPSLMVKSRKVRVFDPEIHPKPLL